MAIKIGILSTFYNNYNYGGKLQAYALTKYLNDLGYDAMQISYNQPSEKRKITLFLQIQRMLKSSDYRNAVIQKLYGKLIKNMTKNIALRKEAFKFFDERIPHTDTVYSDQTINKTIQLFDVFICGSDQIWNPKLLKQGYFLGFVPDNKYKFSYAASIAGELDNKQKVFFKEHLAYLNAVSVREKESQEIVEELLNKKIVVTVDPTLLLEKKDWESIAKPINIENEYIFCYFLGYSSKLRKTVTKIAKKLNVKIVTLPHLLGTTGRYYPCDEWFGDICLYDISPAQFAGLIRDARYVLTDSFHATVLSIIFEKQFLVFERIGFQGMSSRLHDLLDLYDMNKRFCSYNIEMSAAIELLKTEIIYKERYIKLEKRIAISKEYLIKNIQTAGNI